MLIPRTLDLMGEHPGSNRHRHELLEEELTCVRYMDLDDVSFVLAASAFEGILLEISNGNESTLLTNMHSVSIALVK